MQHEHSDQFRQYLIACDLDGVRKLWAHIYPGLPQPDGDYEVQVMVHSARVQAESIPLELRIYSHEWLQANELPSLLPDRLKPSRDQRHNRFAFGVGIAVLADGADPAKAEAAKIVQRAMGDAVEHAFAEGRTDTPFLRRRMEEAREGALRRFGGPKITVNVRHDFGGLPRL